MLVKPAMHVHCWNHCLNLVLQDLVKEMTYFRDPLSYVQQASVLVTNSPHRVNQLKRIAEDLDKKFITVKPFCQTRWTVRGASIRSILGNLGPLLKLFEEIARKDGNATANGLKIAFSQAGTIIALKSALAIFERTEIVAKLLQFEGISFTSIQEARNVLASLKENRVRDFRKIWKETMQLVSQGLITMPEKKRTVVVPSHLSEDLTPGRESSSLKTLEVRAILHHMKAVQFVEDEVEERFSQETINRLEDISNVLLSPWRGFEQGPLKRVIAFFAGDFVENDLHNEVTKLVPNMLHGKKKPECIRSSASCWPPSLLKPSEPSLKP